MADATDNVGLWTPGIERAYSHETLENKGFHPVGVEAGPAPGTQGIQAQARGTPFHESSLGLTARSRWEFLSRNLPARPKFLPNRKTTSLILNSLVEKVLAVPRQQDVQELPEMHLDLNAVRPTSLSHLIGNEAVTRQVRVALDACFEDDCRFPHTLLCGPPGIGKTTLSAVIAQEMASPFIEVLGQNIQKPADLNALLLRATDKAVVFIDEAHELPKAVQTSLYTCLDQRVLRVAGGSGVDDLPLADFSLLLGSTDEHQLLSPMVSRLRCLHLDFYKEAELSQIVVIRARALGWELEDPTIAQLIATRSRSIARRALHILSSSWRVARSEGEKIITTEHLEKACDLEGIDRFGLERRDRQYLRLLLDAPGKVNVLASHLGLPRRTLETHIEPPLIRLGWITKDDQGRRVITAKAKKHLRSVRDE